MVFSIIILFLSALSGGILGFILSTFNQVRFKFFLVFAGSYLFSITVIHILPELFSEDNNLFQVGLFVLIGFFMQQFLDYFSSGTEHGHIHIHDRDHSHSVTSAYVILVALSVHAFLEGTLLAYPSDSHLHHNANTLLAGISLHKIPAAFALVSILGCYLTKKKVIFTFLILFSLMSPLGLVISDYVFENHLLSNQIFTFLIAIVGGNFLHISTTIVFETTPDHSFDLKRLLVSLLGAGVAVTGEYFS